MWTIEVLLWSARSLGVTVDDMVMRPCRCVNKNKVHGRVYATPVKVRYAKRTEASSVNAVPKFIDHHGCYPDHSLAGFQLDCLGYRIPSACSNRSKRYLRN